MCVRMSMYTNTNLDYLIITQMKDLTGLTECCQAKKHTQQCVNERMIK